MNLALNEARDHRLNLLRHSFIFTEKYKYWKPFCNYREFHFVTIEIYNEIHMRYNVNEFSVHHSLNKSNSFRKYYELMQKNSICYQLHLFEDQTLLNLW